MSWFSFLFNEIFYRPLLNALVFLTDVLPFNDLGFAVIVLTLTVRLALSPLMHRSIKTQQKMKMIEPELKKIKDGFDNREEQAKKLMELYRAHGVNPLSGVLLLFLQLPVLIALYLVFRASIQPDPSYLYSFVPVPSHINSFFLGLIDLGRGSIVLAATAAVSQFVQIKLAQLPQTAQKQQKTANDFGKMFSLQMTYFMPVFIFFIAMRFPSAVALYWTTLNLFAIVHEWVVREKAKNIYDTGGNNKENSNDNTKHD